MKQIELKVDGMKCEGCVNRIKKVLSSIKGIDTYEISLEEKKLLLSIKKEKVLEEVIQKIEKLGFTLSFIEKI